MSRHRRGRVLGSTALLSLLLPLFVVTPSHGVSPTATTADQAVLTPSMTGVVFRDGFESGVRKWSTNRRTKLTTVPRGHKSKRAARLRAGKKGITAARRTVPVNSQAGARHVITVQVRSPRGPVASRLVVREVEPRTGKVLQKVRKQVRSTKKWKKARGVLVTRSSSSVLRVAVRAKQRPEDRLLLDRVRVRRTTTGGASSQPTPAPKPSPGQPRGDFPNASNTGVPNGVSLSKYTGPMTITTPGTVIDAKRIDGSITVRAKNVSVKRSRVNGTVFIERSGSLTMTDSVVDGGRSQNSAISQSNFTLKRVEVRGARASVGCDSNCHVEDSWLHAQYMKPGSDWHGDGFLTNGGSNMTLKHNTLACDSKPTGKGGACSAALAAYGDFSPIRNLTVDNNLFVESPAGYCMYAGYDPNKPHGRAASNVAITNNVFERGNNGTCGVYGAVTAVAPSGNGNVFSGNVWDDGKAVRR